MGPFLYEETFECYSSRILFYFILIFTCARVANSIQINLGDSIEVREDGCKKGGFDLEDHDDST